MAASAWWRCAPSRADRWWVTSVQDIRKHIPHVDARVAAIFRGDRPIVPEGTTVVEAGDEVFCLAASQNIRKVMQELRRQDKPVRRVMIAGGGNIGLRLAKRAGERLSGQDRRTQQAPLRRAGHAAR